MTSGTRLRRLLAASALIAASAAGTAGTAAAEPAAPAADQDRVASQGAAAQEAGDPDSGATVAEERSASTAKTSRQQVLDRAKTWLTAIDGHQVPYSQTAFHNGYRTDCSGYASMALGLGTPGLNTVGLAASSVSDPIAMKDLQPGDLVIDATGNNNTRHVVIFEKWDDSKHSSYTAYEQRGHHGTDHRSLKYGLESGSEFKAHRPHVYG